MISCAVLLDRARKLYLSDYGIVPGDTVWTEELQSIIDSEPVNPVVLCFLDGTYLSGKLTINDGQQVLFISHGCSTLKRADGTNDLLIENDQSTFIDKFGIVGMTIDGNHQGQTAHTNTIRVHVNTAYVERNNFINGQGEVLSFAHVNKCAHIINNTFYDGAEHTGAPNGGTNYIALRTSNTRSSDQGQAVTINGNHMFGTVPDSVPGGGVGGIIASGNSALNPFDGHKLNVTSNFLYDLGQDVGVVNGVAVNNRVAAINLYRRSGTSIISDNHIYNRIHKGIDIQGSANCIASNNTIRGVLSGNAGAAIDIAGRDFPPKISDETIVSDNNIADGGVGITSDYGGASPGRTLAVLGNTLTDLSQFIKVENVSGVIKIGDNTMLRCTGTSTTANRAAVAIMCSDVVSALMRDVNVSYTGNTIDDTNSNAVEIHYCGKSIVVGDNTFCNIGGNMLSMDNNNANITLTGNNFKTLKGIAGKFLAVLNANGSLNGAANTFDDSNGLTRSIHIDSGTGEIMLTGTIMKNVPASQIAHFDAHVAPIRVIGLTAPAGYTILETGGSVAVITI